MPKFKTKSNVSFDGKEYPAGSSIELTKEQAATIPWAVENAPDDLEGVDEDVAAALRSVRGNPEHRDSGIQLDWKSDAPTGARKASEIKPEDVEDVSGSEKPMTPEKEGPRKAPKVRTAETATKNSEDTETAGKSAPDAGLAPPPQASTNRPAEKDSTKVDSKK